VTNKIVWNCGCGSSLAVVVLVVPGLGAGTVDGGGNCSRIYCCSTIGANAAPSDDITMGRAVIAQALACATFQAFVCATYHSVATRSATCKIAAAADRSLDPAAAACSSFDPAAVAGSSFGPA
jgi:hypothetical protein